MTADIYIYIGDHPWIYGLEGEAKFDTEQNSWIFKPSSTDYKEWFRVHKSNLKKKFY